MTSLPQIQTAIYETLTSDEPLMGLVTGVFDHVPEGQPLPYVEIGEATELPDNTLTGFGWESTHTLHIWSNARGWAEGLNILSRIVELLDHQDLAIGDRRLVVCRYEFSQTMGDPDPEIRHIPVRFRVFTEQVSP